MTFFSVTMMPVRKKKNCLHTVQFSAVLLLQTTRAKPKVSVWILYILSSASVSVQDRHSVGLHSMSCLFFFLSLSLWLLFAETDSVVIHQVQTVKGAAKKAWRGTGKVTYSFAHSYLFSSHCFLSSLQKNNIYLWLIFKAGILKWNFTLAVCSLDCQKST